MKIKDTLKRFIPEGLRVFLSLSKGYLHDLKRYWRHSNSFSTMNQKQYQAHITYTYHVIEKGLTMPESRLGFGQEKISSLIELCNSYLKKGYDKNDISLKHSVQVLKEYREFHKAQNYELPETINKNIIELSASFGIVTQSKQIHISETDYFKYKNKAFKEFCQSRYTIRNYSNRDIPNEVFRDCTKIAQKSPSACNRQPNNVYIIKEKQKQKEILALQNGNRGFGHLANALIVFTGDISSFRSCEERNEVFLNSGMFIMTYIYALHYYEIGSCALNWSVPSSKDKQLRKTLKIPENETITLILSCGYLPKKLKIALSPRKDTNDVIQYL